MNLKDHHVGDYRTRATMAARLKLAERWSQSYPAVRDAHFAALKRLAGLTKYRP